MLTIQPGVEGSDTYFAQDNYYTKEQGIERSAWYGQGAALLGFGQQAIDPDQYLQLWRGEVGGRRLGRVVNGEVQHRAGWDLTFSAPKSVSILAEVFGIEAVRQAHARAVQHALDQAEGLIQARLTFTGQTVKINTHHGVFACFTHDVNRNLDPQLHTHAFLLNMTYTQSGWRSIHVDRIFDSQKHLQLGKEYRSALARYLVEAGYRLADHRDPTLFEIEGVPPELVRAFSSRAEEIENWFSDRGLDYDPKLAKTVAVMSRKRKKHLTDDEKQQLWHQVAAQFGFTPDQLPRRQHGPQSSGGQAREAVRQAMLHLTERDMGFTLAALEAEALRFSLGTVYACELRAEVERLKTTGGLVPALEHADHGNQEAYWTTPEQKVLERSLLQLMQAEQGGCKALLKTAAIDKGLSKTALNEQQRAALRTALLSSDRFCAIQGDPGVGKTTALREYRRLLDKAGYEVIGMAPSYQAVAELSDSLSIQGMTVDRYIADPRSQTLGRAFRKQVWIVDETSMLASDRVYQLMELAKARDARILFVGDHQQLEAVGAGRAFHQLQRAGMETAVLNQWMRPKNEYMGAVFRYAMGKRYKRLLGAMRREGRLVCHSAEAELIASLAEDWLAQAATERAQSIIVAPTHAQCGQLNHYLRGRLQAEKVIAGREVEQQVFSDRYLTREEVRTVVAYRQGDVVRFAHDHKRVDDKGGGIARDEYFQVLSTNPASNRLALKSLSDARVLYLDPKLVGGNRNGGIQVFEQQRITLAKGDRIRWLNNKNTLGLKRNTTLQVLECTERVMRVAKANGKVLELPTGDLRNRHFTYNYAQTAYGVQGATYKRVFALMNSARVNTTHQRSMMVALTRATHDAVLYTDSEASLLKALERTGDNTEALTQSEFQTTVEYTAGRYATRALI